MGIDLVWRLVLYEEKRIGCLADIMEECSHPGQQSICMDPFRSALSQVGNLQAVLVGAWSALQEVT